MEWMTMDTAPRDGRVILVADVFGVMWARYLTTPTFEEFQDICEEGEGMPEYLEWLEEIQHDQWLYGNFDHDEEIAEAYPQFWMPLPELPHDLC